MDGFAALGRSSDRPPHYLDYRLVSPTSFFTAGTPFLRLWLTNGEWPDRRFHMAFVDEQFTYIADTSAAGFEVHDNLAVFLMITTLLLLP
ncbi:MAG: hypothetical protein ACI8TQ_002458 [Planctomycetota bacterium]